MSLVLIWFHLKWIINACAIRIIIKKDIKSN